MKLTKLLISCAAAALLAGCGSDESSDSAEDIRAFGISEAELFAQEPKHDISALAKEFYAAQPEKFVFSSIDQLPADLVWENGMEEADLGSPEAKKGGTLDYYIPSYPRTVRLVGPNASHGFRSYLLDNNGGPGGMACTATHPETMNRIPAICSEWAVGKDGKTVFYRIDPEARYSDGHPVTSDDFFFNFYFMASDWIQAPWYNDFYKERFTNITKFDDRTFSLTYMAVKPDIVYRTSLRPIPEHFYTHLDEDYTEKYNGVFEPTTGPYVVDYENLVDNQFFVVKRLEDWWLKDRKFYKNRFNVDKIRLRVVSEQAQALKLFQEGELDWYNVSLGEEWHETLSPENDKDVANGYIQKVIFYNERPRVTWGFRINSFRPPLNDQRVREGVQHALNWDAIIEQVFYGDYVRMQSAADGYGPVSNPNVKARGFDPRRARELFADAGYTRMSPQGVLMNDKGEKLQIRLTIGHPWARDFGIILKRDAIKAGLQLNLENLEFAAAMEVQSEKTHEIIFSGLGVSVEHYPGFWEVYHSEQAFENPYVANPKPRANTNNSTLMAVKEVDEMIDKYKVAETMEEITTLSHELIQKIHDYAAFNPGFTKPFYRMAKWRWMRFPEFHDHRIAYDCEDHSVFWIDEDVKAETKAAMKSGKRFPAEVLIHEQHRQQQN